jgi:hypothetical protein
LRIIIGSCRCCISGGLRFGGFFRRLFGKARDTLVGSGMSSVDNHPQTPGKIFIKAHNLLRCASRAFHVATLNRLRDIPYLLPQRSQVLRSPARLSLRAPVGRHDKSSRVHRPHIISCDYRIDNQKGK